MDHANAVETYASERYLLGEMTDADAESFEEHYFDCAVCAEDVRRGAQLLEGGREIVREAAPANTVVPLAERRRKKLGWLQLAAAAVLAIGIAVPQLVHRDVRVSNGPYRQLDATRAGKTIETFRRDQLIGVLYEIQPQPDAVRYELEIRDAHGETVARLAPVTAEEANKTQMLASDPLPVGTYTLSITGVRGDGNRGEVETHQFQVVE